jgi:2,3-bisphosphoglycerate-independent phosphoglycerate mutase
MINFFIKNMTKKTEKKQVMLVVLDGWGYREEKQYNAIAEAQKPNFDRIWNEYPHSLLKASGRAVGLPEGQMGNSEVGHTTIGAGKIVFTDLVRINDSIKENKFSKIPAVKNLFSHVKKNKSALHVMGLVSPGGVHSHIEHLYAVIKSAKLAGIEKIYIHAFTDGRDVPPKSASKYLGELENQIKKIGTGYVSTICGRYWAMDRDNNWDRVEKTEKMLFNGEGNIVKNKKPSEVAEDYCKSGITDEYFKPTIFEDKNGEIHIINKNDGIFFINFRADRARMISKKILEKEKKMNLFFATMTQYDEKLKTKVVFKPIKIETTLAKEISKSKLIQAHIAETEKFAHATYFLNGGVQKAYLKEKHILLNSRKDVPTHDLAPEMKAKEIADEVIKEIQNRTDFIFVNFANPDMVGHTANVPAVIKAIEVTDHELGRIIDVAEKNNVTVLVTADHGNAEVNIDSKTGEKHTAHTTNLVPFILTDKTLEVKNGELSNLAPTILAIFGLKIPKSMNNETLIK